MFQKFLKNISKGDKRVFIINGKVKGAIRRKPKKGSSLSNISQGGVAYSTKLNAKELKISKIVARSLVKNNIFFLCYKLGFLDKYNEFILKCPSKGQCRF